MLKSTIIALIFVFSPLNILANNDEKVFKIPLRRQKPQFQQMAARIVRSQSAAGVDIVKLHDVGDMAYTVTIKLGNPPQEFIVQIDTGSSDFWVYGSDCCAGNGWQKCPAKCARINESNISMCPENCKYKFFPSESSTFKATDNSYFIGYEDLSYCGGPIGKDTLQIGSLTIPDIDFGLANQSNVKMEEEQNYHGIMGMAFTKISDSNPQKVDPPLLRAMKEKLLNENVFTVFMRNSANWEVVDAGGVMTIGSFDTENCEQILGWADIVQDDGYWTIQIDRVSFANKKFLFSSPSLAVSDTGTSFILGPKEIVEQIYAELGVDPDQNKLTIPCDKEYDPIVFEINGRKYEVTKEMLTVKYWNSCRFGMAINIDKSWNLGDPFIRQYCHVYDMAKRRIGFAETKKKQ